MDILQIKIPHRKFEERLPTMDKHAPHHCEIWIMGKSESRQQGVTTLLYHTKMSCTVSGKISRLNPNLEPVLVQAASGLNRHTLEPFSQGMKDMPVELGLVFLTGRERLHVFYATKRRREGDKPVIMSVPGPYMEKMEVLPLEGGPEETARKLVDRKMANADDEQRETKQTEYREGRDRLAGAIGMGNPELGHGLLRRAGKMIVVVIGTGRAGSHLSLRLAKSGVGADGALILVDPDFIEASNVDSMIIASGMTGLPKVEGVARTVSAMSYHRRIKCLQASISAPEVLEVIKMADVVFTAVDEQAARLAAAVIATRYHIVHIDVTGGTARTEKKQAVAGGELRVFVPGTRGCLGCMDRYNWREVVRLLGLSGKEEFERRQGLDWQEQRLGSSADILLPVIGEAMQMFWGVLRGDVKESLWLHYEKDSRCRPVWFDQSGRSTFRRWRRCGICGQQSGLGDIII